MKILCLGDVHLRRSNPINRKDDYFNTQFQKIKYVYDYAVDNQVSMILQPGDLYDRFDCPYSVTEHYIRYFNSQVINIPIFAILGQHDQRYHRSGKENTPIGCLFAGIERTGSKILRVSSPLIFEEEYSKSKIEIYGASWNEEIPEPQNKSAINILVIHKMVTKDGPLWEGQEEYINAQELIKKTNYHLIVCGDNHKSFVEDYRMRRLVNCGSLMRTNIDQFDHKPCFYIYDTKSKSLSYNEIPIEKNVFDTEEVEIKEYENKLLQSFVNKLPNIMRSFEKDKLVTFKDRFTAACRQLPEVEQTIIHEILEEL